MSMTAKAAKPKSGKPHYAGHRQRLKQRFLDQGAEALADYELLEILLFLAIPRGDVKPLAKGLIARFGSFANVVTAPVEELRSVKGVGETAAAALKLAPAAAKRLAQEQVLSAPVISSWEQLIDYCQITLGHLTEEEMHVLYLDKKNRLISDDTHGVGTVDRAPVYPREVIRRALSLQATSLILVHNHPSGDPSPSKEDVTMTREIQAAARTLEITVHDHLIIARGGHNSFKSMGLL